MSQDPVDRRGPPDAIGYRSTDPSTIEELTGADPEWTTDRTYRWLGLGVALVTALVGFGFVGRSGGPPPAGGANADGRTKKNVTGATNFSSSEHLQAAWSPDSRQLAFSIGDYYASTQLWVARADGTDHHSVGGGTLARSDPAWSPDGRLIAFRGHTIGVLPDGTGERRVSQSAGSGGAPNCDCFGGPYVGTAPSWSPDGGTLLYATGTAGHHRLAIAAVDGSSERVIDLPSGDHLLPAFSPDGSRIAFEDLAPAGDHATAFVVGTDGRGLQPLSGGAEIALNPLFWSPDGRFVVTYAVDLSEIHLAAADHDAAGATVAQPSVSISLGESSTGGFPERASWQRLAP